MKEFQIMALTPPASTDPSVAIAASRAGGLGILDLEYAAQGEAVSESILSLSKAARRCGIKLSARKKEFLSWVMQKMPEEIGIIILTWPDGELKRQVETLRARNISVLLEVNSLDEAMSGIEAGVDGFIAKGNEAGGRVGEESAFILLQKILKVSSLPVWAQGGIGAHTAAACYAAGAGGIVLDLQLALARESSLPEPVKNVIARMDGSETVCAGSDLGMMYRVYSKPGNRAVKELMEFERKLAGSTGKVSSEISAAWQEKIESLAGSSDPFADLLLLGQDASFASLLAKRFKTVGGIIKGLRDSIQTHAEFVRGVQPFAESAPLARSHGTRFPIVQGPMARISDRAKFLSSVAEGGALPCFAMGMSRSSEIEGPLSETRQLLGERPWGVGLLGFAPDEVLREHMDLIENFRPPFAVIAGGKPEQALALEKKGVAAYLHVPSPGLLEIFLNKGCRRFIFEGRECGGHIGPRSSFVLWNQSIDVLLEFSAGKALSECHVLFAGGIHDAISSAMVAAMAAPLVEKGFKIGVQIGTAYLFTDEALKTGAIVEGYQKEAINCARTVVLETAPGHASRCVPTPYVEAFRTKKQELLSGNRTAEEVNRELEHLNLGRLRIASRGIDRNPRYEKGSSLPRFIDLSPEEQQTQGMYMIGQVAALRDRSVPIRQLHDDISSLGSQLLKELNVPESAPVRIEKPSDIAIIGMSCVYPKAPDLNTFWENILNKLNAITEIPEERWDWKLFYDQDPMARDKVCSKWGGFLDPVPFDPVFYGMPPDVIKYIEPVQLLALEAVRNALKDAGYEDRDFPRERTSVIFGSGSSMSDLGQNYILRSNLPGYIKDPPPDVLAQLPEWSADSFAGILTNVITGRVANRFNLGGLNYTVDAACASSLAAVHHAVRDLENGSSDMVIVGGADTFNSPFAYFCFSKTLALSPTGQSRPFDENADGICISEGIGVLVLKRLVDAERDGDRIYAVIKGVGGSSDGRNAGITAPHEDGQANAIRRALANAGFSPETVGLIEAHGTGTRVGDATEVKSLAAAFKLNGESSRTCALGSVKSMIGHTKCAAGVAGLIKTSLALYHKILPPTIGIKQPRDVIAKSPFYLNTEPRVWIKTADDPRRAGVSGFGFGGTNFHVALEEYADGASGHADAVARNWPCEIFLWNGATQEELISKVNLISESLKKGARPKLRDLAYTLWENAKARSGPVLAVISGSIGDLQEKLSGALEKLRTGTEKINDPQGVYFSAQPVSGKIAFLFPGQGSQYPGMLRDLAFHFPEVRKRFEIAEESLSGYLPALSSYIFPPPVFSKEDEENLKKRLAQTNVAQPALGAANMGLFSLMGQLGIKPEMAAGHSYGEYAALCAAGVFDEEALYRISEARGRFIFEAAGNGLGTMCAVEAEPGRISEIIKTLDNVWISNLNSPSQTVISGSVEGIGKAGEKLKEQGINVRPVAVSCAFHSPLVAPVKEKLKDFLSSLEFSSPSLPVYSNTSGETYPDDPGEISSRLGEHLVNPVRFVEEIHSMYNSGARVFLEIGPRRILTNLTQQILREHPHIALPLDLPDRNGLLQLHHVLGQLAANGVSVQLDLLYKGRAVRKLDLDALTQEEKVEHTPTTFLVDGGKAVPVNGKYEKKAPDETLSGQMSERKCQARKQFIDHTSPKGEPDSPGSETRQIMLNHQRLMQQFLETQQRIMTAYLQSSSGMVDAFEELPPRSTLSELKALSLNIGTEYETFEKEEKGQTEKVGTITPPPVEKTAPEPAAPAAGKLKEELIQIVNERTGYPAEMLGMDMDLEADLGIDSIKRTEIIGVVQKKYPGLLKDAEKLSRIRTLQGMIDLLSGSEFSAPQKIEVPKDSSATENLPGTASDSRDGIHAELLRIVNERTGYPAEMLGLDMDLEADLGIDSIKRTEIIGVVQKKYPALLKDTEELSRIRTLRGLIDCLAGPAQVLPEKKEAVPPPPLKEASETPIQEKAENANLTDIDEKLSRFLLETVEAPLYKAGLRISKGAVFIITCAEGDISHQLAARIQEQGGVTALAQNGEEFRDLGGGLYKANLADPLSVKELVETIRRELGTISGILHLLPFSEGKWSDDMGLADWKNNLARNVKGLFYLAHSAGQDLKKSARSGGGWLMAVTPGALHGDDVLSGMLPVHGGVAGMIKTVAEEWPEVTCKAVSIGEGPSPGFPLECIVNEMADRQGESEVIYTGSRRLVIRTSYSPVEVASPCIELDKDSVLLLTGGARGITAEVALEFARHCQPVLILMGRSPLPEEKEGAETAGINSPAELKKILIDKFRRAGREIKLSEIETAYRNLLRDREIRTNLETMKKTGARVRYIQADARDERSFSGVIDQIHKDFGRLDGIIHGAGVIEDKLLEDKLPDSFDRVFDTKADSAFILGKRLGPSLKFIVFFSSIAGRFGNRGQCDYAAANETVNKVALGLDRRWQCRVISANWGPWSKSAGMVTDKIQEQFSRRGVQMIPLQAGCRALLNEILFGRKGDVEVVFGDGPWGIAPARFPLLRNAQMNRMEDGSLEVIKTFDPDYDLYLRDHMLDKKPVVPFTFIMELMSEVAQQGWIDKMATGIHSFQLFRGIVLDEGGKTVHVVARAKGDGQEESAGREIEIEITEPDKPKIPLYRGIVQMMRRPVESPEFDPARSSKIEPFPFTTAEAYRRWLFHGPLFQNIISVAGIGNNEICGDIKPSSASVCLLENSPGAWLMDPVVLDSSFQLLLLWQRSNYDSTCLPSRFASFRTYGSLQRGPVRCYISATPSNYGQHLVADIFFLDRSGRLVACFEKMEFNCSKALNRLADSK